MENLGSLIKMRLIGYNLYSYFNKGCPRAKRKSRIQARKFQDMGNESERYRNAANGRLSTIFLKSKYYIFQTEVLVYCRNRAWYIF